VPVTLVAGPLGAGKTTLTRRVVESVRDFTLGVVVNDFAALNVDSQVIEEDIARQHQQAQAAAADGGLADVRVKGAADPPRVIELSGGCICCSLSAGLGRAVEAMLERSGSQVDYILVETSGLTDPVEMVRIIENELDRGKVRLDSVVFVLDADNYEGVLADAALRRQLEHADVVVLNKVDLLPLNGPDAIGPDGGPANGAEASSPATAKTAQRRSDALAALCRRIEEVTAARVLTSEFGNVPLERIMDLVRIEPEREAFGRMVLSQEERARLGGYTIPDHGGNIMLRASVEKDAAGAHAHAPLSESNTSFVFSAATPFRLDLLQSLVFSDERLRSALARAKGTVFISEVPGERFTLELSGRARLDVVSRGRWPAPPRSAMALVARSGPVSVEEVAEALTHAASAAVEDEPAAWGSALPDALGENKNLEVLRVDPTVVVVRLTGGRTFNFTAEELRIRFGLDLDDVNRSFARAINASGHCVLAVPVVHAIGEEGASIAAVALARSAPLEEVLAAVETASRATFAADFAVVRLCACD